LNLGPALLRHAARLGQLIRTEGLFFEKYFSEIPAPFGHGTFSGSNQIGDMG
jgi:hypothetical protein